MQHKVGHDILKLQPSESPVKFYTGKKDYASKILKILKDSERPLCVEEIRNLVGIPSWVTTKCVVMDLVLCGRVEVFKSGRQFLFRVKKQSHSQSKTTVT